MKFSTALVAVAFLSLLMRGETIHAADTAPVLPPVATADVDFDRDIKPILQMNCLKCHSRGKYKGGLSLETRESTLKGGEDGAAVIVGHSEKSPLIELVATNDPDKKMPSKGDALTAAQIGLLRAWIDRGMNWPASQSFGFRKAPLAPRRPELSAGDSATNPIDRILTGYLKDHGTASESSLIDDRTFIRRASLDLVGLLPTPEQLDAFEADRSPGKRAALVAELLSNNKAYADHWLTFWNDMLRNAYRGTGFIDGGRNPITPWLYHALYDNKPYNTFVHELISPVAGSEGFTKGIVWRGVVNASQVPPVQAAQNVAQVFLGTNLKCASCHDSFVNYWKLADAYALASVFAEKPLEIHRCDKPTGKTSAVGFIYPELGTIDPAAPRDVRMKQLADIIIKPENGRFARTIVNRLWAQMMGRGIIEPVDDMDQEAWSQDLLDWLASDFVEHGCDMKHTLSLICTSRAYQMRAVAMALPGDKQVYAFAGPTVKRMTAEQFTDAITAMTGVGPSAASADIGKLGVSPPAASSDTKLEAKWIWSHADAGKADPGGRILLRKTLTLTEKPNRAAAVLTCDNEVTLYLNGRKLISSEDWQKPVVVDLTSHLAVGENVFAIEATNWPDVEHNRGTQFKAGNGAGFIFEAVGFKGKTQAWTLSSDATWLWTKNADKAWMKPGFDTAGWQHVSELTDIPDSYKTLPLAELVMGKSAAAPHEVRAALAQDDALTRALGRPNREQVVTRRESIATTLQAIELTNGSTLDAALKKGAGKWLGQNADPAGLARAIYLAALGRAPTAVELASAMELLGEKPTLESVEDLLWVVTMLPEFQLIY